MAKVFWVSSRMWAFLGRVAKMTRVSLANSLEMVLDEKGRHAYTYDLMTLEQYREASHSVVVKYTNYQAYTALVRGLRSDPDKSISMMVAGVPDTVDVGKVSDQIRKIKPIVFGSKKPPRKGENVIRFAVNPSRLADKVEQNMKELGQDLAGLVMRVYERSAQVASSPSATLPGPRLEFDSDEIEALIAPAVKDPSGALSGYDWMMKLSDIERDIIADVAEEMEDEPGMP